MITKSKFHRIELKKNPKISRFRCFLGYTENFNTDWQYFLFPFKSQYHIVKKDDDRNFNVMSQYFGQSLIRLIKTYA